MKTRLFKSILALAMMFVAMPMMAQDFLNIYFKDGSFRIFHFDNIEEINLSKADEDGVLYTDFRFQHIVTKNDEYFYDLAEIDSISFTKYQEEVEKENTKEALTTALPLFSDCESASEVETKIEDIKNSDGVETAWIEGDWVFVKIKGGHTISFNFDSDNIEENENDYNLQASRILQAIPERTGNGLNLKAVVANQQHFDNTISRNNKRDNYMKPLRDDFVAAGFQSGDYSNIYVEKPDLDFFYDKIFDYDVIFLSTHGGYSENSGHLLLTGETLGLPILVGEDNLNDPTEAEKIVPTDNFNRILLREKFKDSKDDMIMHFQKESRMINSQRREYWVPYVVIKESFFNTVKKRFSNNNSFLFVTACQSLKGIGIQANSLANILRTNRGLGTYVGYNNSTAYGAYAGCTMLREMLTGVSAEKAYNDLANHSISNSSAKKTITGTYKDEDHVERKYDNEQGIYVEKARWTASVKMLPEESHCFITPVFTSEMDYENAEKTYDEDHSVFLSAIAITTDRNKISMGFRYGTDKNNLNKKLPAKAFTPEVGNCKFSEKLKNVEREKTYYYCAYTYDKMNYNYGDTLEFTLTAKAYTKCPDDHHPHLIDLGLPSGTKWACCNVGADKPEEYGSFFAWGENVTKDRYYWDNYAYGSSWNDVKYLGSDIGGTEYDVATFKWQSPWHMPSYEQCRELLENCSSVWTSQNGVNGRLFTGSNGGTIFMPAAGFHGSSTVLNRGSYGNYWTSSVIPSSIDCASGIRFTSSNLSIGDESRCIGRSIRPVR